MAFRAFRSKFAFYSRSQSEEVAATRELASDEAARRARRAVSRLLYQDDGGGLQVSDAAARWRSIWPHLGAFVVNISDTFMTLSNGRYRSCLHRAVVNSRLPRRSIDFFLCTEMDKLVRPPKELVDDDNHRAYPNFTWRMLLDFTMRNYRSKASDATTPGDAHELARTLLGCGRDAEGATMRGAACEEVHTLLGCGRASEGSTTRGAACEVARSVLGRGSAAEGATSCGAARRPRLRSVRDRSGGAHLPVPMRVRKGEAMQMATGRQLMLLRTLGQFFFAVCSTSLHLWFASQHRVCLPKSISNKLA